MKKLFLYSDTVISCLPKKKEKKTYRVILKQTTNMWNYSINIFTGIKNVLLTHAGVNIGNWQFFHEKSPEDIYLTPNTSTDVKALSRGIGVANNA